MEFKLTLQHANADGLSRLPLPVKHQLVPDTFLIGQLQALPVTTERLQVVTRQDPILSRVLQFVREGWPGDDDQKMELKPYESRKEELSTEGDCLLSGNRVVIPHKLRSRGETRSTDLYGSNRIGSAMETPHRPPKRVG